MEPLQRFDRYARRFVGADAPWPDLPPPLTERDLWWRRWAAELAPADLWMSLRQHCPQLLITPHADAHLSETYRRLVLRGRRPTEDDLQRAPCLADPEGLRLSIAAHPSGPVPVLDVADRSDFVLLIQCLAHRCEPVALQPSVHAQAIDGLIHWGLIRDVNRDTRCQVLILHQAPYSSLSAACLPVAMDQARWLEASRRWRLAHELTHLACQRLFGEMRINLYDELIADAVGMVAALGRFDADLFRQGLGLSPAGELLPGGRAQAYVGPLDPADHGLAYQSVLQRAQDLEGLLQRGQVPCDGMALLQCLGRQRLDQPLQALDQRQP